MEFTKTELDILIGSRPDLDLKKIPVPSLDAAIVEFLKKYEIFVKPVTSQSNNRTDTAIAGAIGGAFGADVAGDAFIFSGQNKQTQVQEWNHWKQWALDHKEFPAFKEEKIDKVQRHNDKIDGLLKSPEIQKEGKKIRQDLMEKEAKEGRDQGILVGFGCLGSLILLIVLVAFLPDQNTVDTNSEDQSMIISSELIRKV